MKSLKQIIKLKKKELDDQKIRLGELEKKLTKLVENIHLIKQTVEKETSFVETESDYMFLFANFFNRSTKNLENISLEIKKYLLEIERERVILMDLFAELKKFEQLLEKQQEDQKYQEKIIETKFFDEISITRHNKDF